MTRSFTVRSGKDGALLELSARGGSLLVHLKVGGLDAATDVDAYMSSGLPLLFEEMAREWRGWAGTKEWESLEGDFCLECEHDRVGHVSMRVSMLSDLQGWSLEGKLVLEPGMLEQLASDARAFYDGTGWGTE